MDTKLDFFNYNFPSPTVYLVSDYRRGYPKIPLVCSAPSASVESSLAAQQARNRTYTNARIRFNHFDSSLLADMITPISKLSPSRPSLPVPFHSLITSSQLYHILGSPPVSFRHQLLVPLKTTSASCSSVLRASRTHSVHSSPAGKNLASFYKFASPQFLSLTLLPPNYAYSMIIPSHSPWSYALIRLCTSPPCTSDCSRTRAPVDEKNWKDILEQG